MSDTPFNGSVPPPGLPPSDHARLRSTQGRPIGQVVNDVQRAGPNDVFVQPDDGRFVVKTITTPDGRQFLERVRLYPLEELVAMIGEAGGQVRHQFGTYDGGPVGPDAPRVILFARVV